ncbi:MAG: CBS domain-containing protein [Nitrospirae bacterium]|nr:CBS domain-containing protein [Nitrospirota bacterium]
MDVITSHINADFDALASMMAAKKLYPDAHLVFPGAQERSMREFFMQSTIYAMKFDKFKNLNLDDVTRLIIVDAKTPDRIGRFTEIIGRPGLKIHIYDHHPPGEGDIRGEFEHLEPLGACTTIFVELLQKKKIPVNPVEATVLALGIYEETGSLVFASTTPRDVTAAAWLLSQGANLNIVSDFITRELDAEQVSLLNDLLKSMGMYYFNGLKVAVATASTARYVQDLAILSHKIRDMENLDALFCVVRMEERVFVVARSRVDEVDVGEVAREFGGGGHPTAASATLQDTNVAKVVERLLDILKKTVHPIKLARDIMTKPVITIKDTADISEANEQMTRYSVNVLPVLHAGRLVGLLTREVAQRSLHHGLGERNVREVMTTDFQTVPQDAGFRTVEEIMIRHAQRFLPVIEDDDRVVGAITRTDLLRALHESIDARRVSEAGVGRKGDEVYTRNVAGLIDDRLPPEVLRLLHDVGRMADEIGVTAYVVGGFVRDLLMGVRNLDVDIVVEGGGIAFAQAFAKRHNGRARVHQKFGTAVVVLPSGMKFDIATARTEYYEYPAALPTVELGSIKKDLYRRDFTVNALAIRINAEEFGELIDFFGGQRDLKEKTIRVLHNLSLIEDPTRAFRAIRFENRMGFTISRHTQNLIRNAVKMDLFHKLSGTRVYTELVLIFKETKPARALQRLEAFGLLKFIHPKLRFTRELESLFSNISETLSWFRLLFLDVEAEPWVVYFMGLFDQVPDKEKGEFADRLVMPERYRIKIDAAMRDGAKALNEFYRYPVLAPYQVYMLLKPLPVEALLFMMAKARVENAKKNVSLYLTQYREAAPMLTGADLKRMGFAPGPVFKRLLERLLEARLNGHVETRDDEAAFVREYARVHDKELKSLEFQTPFQKANGQKGKNP